MAIYSRGKVRRSLIDTVTFRVVSQIATVLSYVLMVRGMSKEDFGVLNLLYAYIPAVSTLASLGLEQTLRRYQPEYLSAGNKSAALWLMRFVASARFASNLVLLVVVLLAWNYFAPIFKIIPYRPQFAIFGLIVLLHFQARVLQLSLASHMLHRYSMGSVALLSIAKLIAYGLLIWFDTFTLLHAILADTIGHAIVYLFLRTTYRRHCLPERTTEPYRPGQQERKRLLRYGFYNNFNDAGSFILGSTADFFFIAAFLDPVAVGVYAFYSRLKKMALRLKPVRLFDNVVHPMFFAIPSADADRQLPRFYSLLINMDLLIQLPALTYAIAYHAELVQVIFGGKFIEYSWLLPLMVVFPTLSIIATPATLVAQYEEKAAIILVSKIFVIYNVLALLVLLPIAGLYGVAIATGSANVFKTAFIWWHVRKHAVWTNFGAVLINGVLVWGAAVAVCYALKTWLGVPVIVHLGFGVMVCAVAELVYLRSAAISSSDRAILASVLSGREARLLRLVGLLVPTDRRQPSS